MFPKDKLTKVVPLAVAAAMLFGLTACSAPASTSGGTAPIKMTLIQGIKGDEFYISVACGAEQEAKKLGVELSVQGPQLFDATLQTPILNAAIATKPSAILIAANDTTGMVPTFKKARAQGIALVAFDQIVQTPGVMDAQVASDSVEGGKLAAQELLRQMGSKGTVLVVSLTPAIAGGEQRAQGFEDEIKKSSGIKLLDRQYSNNDPVKAASIVSATLAAHPDLTGIFAVNLMSGEGAANALKAAGGTGKVKLVEADASPAQVKALKDGAVQALVAQQPLSEGQVAVQQAYNKIKGKKVTEMTSTGWVTVTKDNIADPNVSKYLYQSTCS